MPGRPGRDQRAPIERLVTVLFLLSQAEPAGCPVERILRLGLYDGQPQGQQDQLARDVRHLRSMGWDIVNVADRGTAARYRLEAHDNRLRAQFSVAERYELLRCSRIGGLRDLERDLRDDIAAPATPEGPAPAAPSALAVSIVPPGPDLAVALTALASSCRLRFDYLGRSRDVVPRRVYDRSGTWYLVAREVDGQVTKTFRLDRMQHVRLAEQVAADTAVPLTGPQLDPMAWQRHEPIEVQVRTTREHRDLVVATLGNPVEERPDADGTRVTFRTANRDAFLQRICRLGPRVWLIGPPDLRDRLREHLLAVVGEA